MPKWTDYTIKTTVADNDEIMTLDTAGKANKRLSLSTLSDWVLGKIADKVFEKLQTNDKTILGAINELNSNNQNFIQGIAYVDVTGKTIPAVTSNSFLDVDTGDNYKGAKNILFQSAQTSIIVISAYMSLETKTWHIRVNNSTGTITNITGFPVKYLGFIS